MLCVWLLLIGFDMFNSLVVFWGLVSAQLDLNSMLFSEQLIFRNLYTRILHYYVILILPSQETPKCYTIHQVKHRVKYIYLYKHSSKRMDQLHCFMNKTAVKWLLQFLCWFQSQRGFIIILATYKYKLKWNSYLQGSQCNMEHTVQLHSSTINTK